MAATNPASADGKKSALIWMISAARKCNFDCINASCYAIKFREMLTGET